MATDVKALYLDLMKKALSYSLWPEPPEPIERTSEAYRLPRFRKALLYAMIKIFRSRNLQVVRSRSLSQDDREQGKYWPVLADTMIGMKRLDNIQYCVESVLTENIEGDLIETGVWRGGACILMRAILAAHGVTDRKVFVADSFEGLPKPNAQVYSEDYGDRHHQYEFLAVSEEEVRENFDKYGLMDNQVIFLKGWFKDTLPAAPITKLAVLRLDGDMYESTMDALVNLYPILSVGGYCIIDDYSLKPCRAAITDYRSKNQIESPIHTIDYTGVYWRK